MAATREAIAAALQFDADGLTHEVTQEHADAYNAIGATLTGQQSDDDDEMAAIRALTFDLYGVRGPGPRHWRVYQTLLAGGAG